jgi:hypothetical protein
MYIFTAMRTSNLKHNNLICVLFSESCDIVWFINDAVSSADHLVSNDRIGKDTEGSSYGLIFGNILSFAWGGNEENHENLSQYSLSLGRDLELGPPEYEVGVLTTWLQYLVWELWYFHIKHQIKNVYAGNF